MNATHLIDRQTERRADIVSHGHLGYPDTVASARAVDAVPPDLCHSIGKRKKHIEHRVHDADRLIG